MRDMLNVAFQRGWFGPTAIPDVYTAPPPPEPPVGPVYDLGPLDGLRTTSIWAQRMAQIPIRNYAQQPEMGVSNMGQAPVFCKPGYVPVPTGVPGQSKCVPYSPPSSMLGPQPRVTVNTQVPPSYTPGQRTFPVGPFFGFRP